jgi:hypothetical protein
MKKLWLIFFLPILIISSPKEEIIPEDKGPILAEADIGPAGGTLAAEGITLDVPPGSFPVLTTVSIIPDEELADDFVGNSVTPIYRIDGIPSRTEGPFTIRIKY